MPDENQYCTESCTEFFTQKTVYHIRFIYLKIFLHQAPQIILSLSKFLWWEVGWHMCRRKAYLAQPSLVGGGVRESQGFSKDGG